MPGPGSTHSMCVICTITRSCYTVKHSDSVCTLHCLVAYGYSYIILKVHGIGVPCIG